jgi:hypothetical protein
MRFQRACWAVLGSGHRCASLVDSAYDVGLTGLACQWRALSPARRRAQRWVRPFTDPVDTTSRRSGRRADGRRERDRRPAAALTLVDGTHDAFQFPTTAIRSGNRLAMVNGKFDTGFPPPPISTKSRSSTGSRRDTTEARRMICG